MNGGDPTLYRPCVGVMFVNVEGKAFVGKRIDNREGDWWQMPQGGIDEGEEPGAALMRKLPEENGPWPEHVEVRGQLQEELFYDLPDDLRGKLWGGCFVGQRQTWFLARFTGSDGDIDLEAHDPPEFCEWKWVEPALLPELIVPFKREVYRTIVEGFSPLLK